MCSFFWIYFPFFIFRWISLAEEQLWCSTDGQTDAQRQTDVFGRSYRSCRSCRPPLPSRPGWDQTYSLSHTRARSRALWKQFLLAFSSTPPFPCCPVAFAAPPESRNMLLFLSFPAFPPPPLNVSCLLIGEQEHSVRKIRGYTLGFRVRAHRGQQIINISFASFLRFGNFELTEKKWQTVFTFT